MTEPHEFDCIDCGTHVVSFGFWIPHERNLCATCIWLRNVEASITDPAEKERFRRTVKSFRGLSNGDVS